MLITERKESITKDTIRIVTPQLSQYTGEKMRHYLPEAGINGTDKDSEGLPSVAPHGAEDFAEESDEPQPALHVALLQLLPHCEIFLQRGQTTGGIRKTTFHWKRRRLSREGIKKRGN